MHATCRCSGPPSPLPALVMALTLASSSLPARADAIDDIVAAELKRQHSPAVAIAVVRNGKPVKVRGWGLANLEHRAPATADTPFQTASVGKQFTAALVMLLVRDGRLRLDAPVTTYLGDAPASWRGITVQHLLTHTSGLERTDPAIDLWKDYTEAELLASAYRLPPKSPPGERFEYSNLGYQLLGVLCSRVGGRFWGEQMRERLFVPLRMEARVISERDLVPGRSAGYERFDGQFENQRWVAPTQNTTADGSLYVSARDMARWAVALDGQQILTQSEKQAMWQPTALADGQRVDYGYGWRLFTDAGHRIVRHRGDWQGYTTHLLHMPEDRLTVTVLMNRSHAQPHVIADRIAAHFVPALRKPAPVPPSNAALLAMPLFLRGTLNDWQATLPFERTAPGMLQARAVLQAGMQQFKIGDARWEVADFGARYDEALARSGRPQPLEFKGEDLFLEVGRPGEHTFVLDLRGHGAPVLTIVAP